jgi:hypothetical protein
MLFATFQPVLSVLYEYLFILHLTGPSYEVDSTESEWQDENLNSSTLALKSKIDF